MPITKSAEKAQRQTKTKTIFNRRAKKLVTDAIASFKKAPTPAGLKSVFSNIDKAVKKAILPKKRAARIKSKLAKSLAPKNKAAIPKKKPKGKKKAS